MRILLHVDRTLLIVPPAIMVWVADTIQHFYAQVLTGILLRYKNFFDFPGINSDGSRLDKSQNERNLAWHFNVVTCALLICFPNESEIMSSYWKDTQPGKQWAIELRPLLSDASLSNVMLERELIESVDFKDYYLRYKTQPIQPLKNSIWKMFF